MLSDDARKILIVAWNLYRNEWVRIDVSEIVLRSGRDERRVRAALNELVRAYYIDHKDGVSRVLRSSPLSRY